MKLKEIITALRQCEVNNSSTCQKCPAYNQSAGCLDLLHKEAAELIEGLLAERRWIPVTERLPEPDTQVLAIVSGRWENITFDRAYELASWSADEGWIMEAWPDLEDPEVTHWTPLPEPPKGERYGQF